MATSVSQAVSSAAIPGGKRRRAGKQRHGHPYQLHRQRELRHRRRRPVQHSPRHADQLHHNRQLRDCGGRPGERRCDDAHRHHRRGQHRESRRGASDIGVLARAISGSFSLIGTGGSGGLTNGTSGNQVNVANPRLSPLGDYGGPTMTFALLPGSTAKWRTHLHSRHPHRRTVFRSTRLCPTSALPDQPTNREYCGRWHRRGFARPELAQAINLANVLGGVRAISFRTPTVFSTPQTITLTAGQLALSNSSLSTSITAPAAGLTISGGGTTRVFEIGSQVKAAFSGLTITGGLDDRRRRRDGKRWQHHALRMHHRTGIPHLKAAASTTA